MSECMCEREREIQGLRGSVSCQLCVFENVCTYNVCTLGHLNVCVFVCKDKEEKRKSRETRARIKWRE